MTYKELIMKRLEIIVLEHKIRKAIINKEYDKVEKLAKICADNQYDLILLTPHKNNYDEIEEEDIIPWNEVYRNK